MSISDLKFHIWTPSWSYDKVDLDRCRFSVHDGGRSVGFHQCSNRAEHNIQSYGICSKHASGLSFDLIPKSLLKRVEGAEWNPGDTIYCVDVGYGRMKLQSDTVVKVMKNGLKLSTGVSSLGYKSVVDPKLVSKTPHAAWCKAAKRAEDEIFHLQEKMKEQHKLMDDCLQKAREC
jgi:hypothetical protein